ncbi:hypothetical protein PIB19_07005 [Sphingomonas sp. 7/4-4]|nr:hypothetical protein [Sphingomonas sp. 7/4-4]WBY09097.1 hypothetical protein PIB19_07005 [Sphingomonas sp. 7/4-4]
MEHQHERRGGHDTASPTMEVPLRTLADTGGAEAFTVGPAPR